MLSKVIRLARVVWDHGGVLKVWALATGLATFSGKLTEWTGFDPTGVLPTWFPAPAWWWGLVVLALWVIYSLANRVLKYETPGLAIDVRPDRRDNGRTWWIEIRNTGGSMLKQCAVDYERIGNAAGELVFPHSFGMARLGGLSNPFPLRAMQPKHGMLATLDGEHIIIFAYTVDRQETPIKLVLDKYCITVGAYSEADGSQCKRVLTIERRGEFLHVE